MGKLFTRRARFEKNVKAAGRALIKKQGEDLFLAKDSKRPWGGTGRGGKIVCTYRNCLRGFSAPFPIHPDYVFESILMISTL